MRQFPLPSDTWAKLPLPWRVVVVQLAATVVFTLVVMPLGSMTALSALMGGGVAVLPNASLARTVVTRRRVSPLVSARALVLAGYAKLVMTLVLMMLVFALFTGLVPQAFFGSFIAVLALHWLAPLLDHR